MTEADSDRPGYGDAISTPFWEGCMRKELLVQYSPQAGAFQFYPRLRCIRTGGPVEWRRAAGTGTIYSRVVVHASLIPGTEKEVPYVIAVVELDEGVRMTTRVLEVGCQIGDRVKVVWLERASKPPLPVFTVIPEPREIES